MEALASTSKVVLISPSIAPLRTAVGGTAGTRTLALSIAESLPAELETRTETSQTPAAAPRCMVAVLPLWEKTEQAPVAEKAKLRGVSPVEAPALTPKVVLISPLTTPARTAVGGVTGGPGEDGLDAFEVSAWAGSRAVSTMGLVHCLGTN